MSLEKSLRKRVLKALAPLDACAVENKACPGFPDVEFIGGVMELKVIDDWPVRERTPVRVPKFRQEQRIWLRGRWQAGGLALLLLKVYRDEFLLFNGDVAADHLGNVPREELEEAARYIWGPGKFRDGSMLLTVIKYESGARYVSRGNDLS